MIALIKQQDIIQSIADSLQFISYYHPQDFIEALSAAYNKEQSIIAKNAMAQILINSKMCAIGKRPLCQDTGLVNVFVKFGMDVKLIETTMSFENMINEGVKIAYNCPTNKLRASIIKDPLFKRQNTINNTPAIIHTQIVEGNTIEFEIAAKGGGSENKTKFAMLNPSDSIVDWVINNIKTMGAGWCPPGIIGIGVGGSAEKSMLLAKQSLMDKIDMPQLLKNGPNNDLESLRIELYNKINALGIGAQGLGGITTVLDVKILDYPTHAASKPIAMIPNCAATRHVHFTLDGQNPITLTPPDLNAYPDISIDNFTNLKKINVNQITKKDLVNWKVGETILLSGTILTGRDAAHKRLTNLLETNMPLPVDLHNKFIYYVGPVDPINAEVVGPAGPTTSTRMDKFTPILLEKTGLMGMIGKAERTKIAIDAIKNNQSIYLIAVGGAAYLVSQAIKKARVVAFEDLGMEAIYEFEIKDMPVTVAVDCQGNSIHELEPKRWEKIIKEVK